MRFLPQARPAAAADARALHGLPRGPPRGPARGAAPTAGAASPATTWTASSPRASRPTTTRARAFPLAGAHLAVACDDCHDEVPRERLRALGVRPRRRAPARTEQLRFASTAVRRSATATRTAGRPRASGRARPATRRRPGRRSRSTTRARAFPLVGAATPRVACRGCHPGERRRAGLHRPPDECARAATRTPTRGRFARNGRTDCAALPRADAVDARRELRPRPRDRRSSWRERIGRVPCAGCHRRQTADGRSIMQYSGIGRTCTACHGGGRVGPWQGRGVVNRSRRFLPRALAHAGSRSARRSCVTAQAPARVPEPARRSRRRLHDLPHRPRAGRRCASRCSSTTRARASRSWPRTPRPAAATATAAWSSPRWRPPAPTATATRIAARWARSARPATRRSRGPTGRSPSASTRAPASRSSAAHAGLDCEACHRRPQPREYTALTPECVGLPPARLPGHDESRPRARCGFPRSARSATRRPPRTWQGGDLRRSASRTRRPSRSPARTPA